jgi:hypothetical protein
VNSLIGSRIYLQPKATIINTILDIVELQRGKTVYSDTANGIVHFLVSMYGYKWEYRFAVLDIGKNRCKVKLEVEGDTKQKRRHIIREFALLESMLINEAQIEFEDKAEVESEQYADDVMSELKKKTSRRISRIYPYIAACAAIAVIAVGVLFQPTRIYLSDELVPLAAILVIDENAKPYTDTEPRLITVEGIKIPEMVSATIPANTEDAWILLINPKDNTCNFKFEITADDEPLYTSGLIEPGKHIEELSLSKGLAQGEYKAVLTIRAYEPGSVTEAKNIKMEFTLTAKEREASP